MSTIEQVLKPIYYNPSTGFQSATKLYERVKKTEKGKKFTLAEVDEWVKKQNVQQLFSQPRVTAEKFSPIMTAGINHEWHLDLVDMRQFKDQGNNGTAWILVVVDILSRYMWGVPMKDKTAASSANAFRKVLKSAENKPFNITTDSGSEFKGAFGTLVDDNVIIHRMVNSGDHRALGKIDAAIKKLKIVIFKWMSINGPKWAPHLKEFVDNYNTTPHMNLQIGNEMLSPSEITEDNADAIYQSEYKRKKEVEKKKKINLLNVGDKVRVKLSVVKSLFPKQRAFKQVWTTETYPIVKVNKVTYTVNVGTEVKPREKRLDFNDVRAAAILDEDTAEIDEILKTRTRKGKKELFVSWKGYDKSHNQWILESELVTSTS